MDDEFYFGDRRIRIVMQDRYGRVAMRATRRFTGGSAGASDAGVYAFWTVMDGARPLFLLRTKEHHPIEDVLCDRARLSEGQRTAMEALADRVLPATAEEIKLWLQANPAEAAFVASA